MKTWYHGTTFCYDELLIGSWVTDSVATALQYAITRALDRKIDCRVVGILMLPDDAVEEGVEFGGVITGTLKDNSDVFRWMTHAEALSHLPEDVRKYYGIPNEIVDLTHLIKG